MSIWIVFGVNSARIRTSNSCGISASITQKYGKNLKTTSDGQTDRTREREKAFSISKSGLLLKMLGRRKDCR